ncbi:hypothetical protein E2562_008712 [Oryza meyeriana var. granulata]|uniref:Uncharacterized protein n=1 Tax=Oryza meyeriana var. granulata TaxID=110450 RepID=A0A6G1F5N3_9ORYZ|nr:hypothetical protein E2562_008712 [Oryza meyeriana var. granulata]
MDDDDDDFTFPAPAASAAAVPSSQDGLGVGLLWPRLPAASSTLWPFSSSSPSATPPPPVHATDDAAAAAARGNSGQATAVARHDKERMDLLWEHGPAAMAPADEERMDLLWEDFNDELLLQLRRQRAAGTSSADDDDRSSPPPQPPSDEEETSSPAEQRYGCAPTMLRASSRAGAVGQFYGRRGRGRSRATGWELLLRLFRKLFAVDKSSPPCHRRRRHGSIYVP